MYDAYTRIFTRLGLKFRAVAADTGAIGGSASHEFHVLADSGEDAIAFSDGSDYAANIEMAEAIAPAAPRAAPAEELRKVATPWQRTCEEVAKLLGIELSRTVKSVALIGRAGLRAGAGARRPHGQRDQAGQAAGPGRLPAGHRSGNPRTPGHRAGLPRPDQSD